MFLVSCLGCNFARVREDCLWIFLCPFLSMATEKDEKSATWGKTPSVFPQVPYLRSERGASLLIARKVAQEMGAATSAAASVAVLAEENGCWRRLLCNLLKFRAHMRAKRRWGKLSHGYIFLG